MTSTQPRPGAASTLIALVLAAVVIVDLFTVARSEDISHIDGGLMTKSDQLVVEGLLVIMLLAFAAWMWRRPTGKSVMWTIVAMILAGPVGVLVGWAIPALDVVGFFLLFGGILLAILGWFCIFGEGIALAIRKMRSR